MAALTTAAVALYPTVANGGLSLAEHQFGYPANSLLKRSLKLTLTGQGGQSNTIGATALGFSKLIECSNLFDDENNKGYPAAVDPVTNTIVLFDGAAAPAPVDVTSNAAYITVTGIPFLQATAPAV